MDISIEHIMKSASNTEIYHGMVYDSIYEYISHLHAEVSEIFEELKNGHDPDQIYHVESETDLIQVEKGVPSELADVVIIACLIASNYNVNLSDAIIRKLEYNRYRDRGGSR